MIFGKQHHERISFRGAASGLTVLLLLYVMVPLLLVRFGCAAGIALVLVGWLGAAAWKSVVQTGAVALFAAAFLLTPYASYVLAPPAAPNPIGRAFVLQGALLLIGTLWLGGVAAFGRGFRVWRHRPAWPVAVLFLFLFLAAVLRPWLADLTYAGDEVFHTDMIRMCNGLLRAIITSRAVWFVLACPFFIGIGVWFGLGGPRRQLRRYRPFLLGVFGVSLLLVAAGAALLAYPDSFLRDGYSRGLAFRFPAGEAWLSALLMAASFSPLPVAVEFFRFLPCLSAALLGLFLLADRRWRTLPWPAVALAGCGLALIPNLYYHATLVYLEVPAVLLFTVALADAERLVRLPWRRVGRLPAFWALLLAGFTKEVAAPGLVLLLGTRWLCQLWVARKQGLVRVDANSAAPAALKPGHQPARVHASACPAVTPAAGSTNTAEPDRLKSGHQAVGVHASACLGLSRRRVGRPAVIGLVLAESALAGTLLLPVLLYLAVRYGQQIRPYAMRVDNWLHPSLWVQALGQMAVQTGPLLLFAAAGAWVAWRARRYGFLAANVLFGVGMFLFFFAEKAEYIGLARFNLLLLPPILVLGREGLLACARRSRTAGLIAVLLLVLGNVWLAPVQHDGSRKPWGNTGESWYPFRDCLLDARQLAPQGARVLFGNMPLQYGVAFVLQELGWTVENGTVDLAEAVPVAAEIATTLEYADRRGFNVLVYRCGQAEPLPLLAPLPPGWQLVRPYGDAQGFLLLFLKPAEAGSQ